MAKDTGKTTKNKTTKDKAPKSERQAVTARTLDDIVGDDELAQLQDDLANAPDTEDFPDAFVFEQVNDQLVGRVVGTGTVENEYGEYPVLTIERNGELLALHGLGTILKRELARAVEGSLVAVKFLGEKPGKNGRDYKDYKVIIRKG